MYREKGNMTYKKTVWLSKMVTMLFIGMILLLPLQVNAKEMHNGEYVRDQENVIKINGYINDYANIVDDETEKKIEKKGERLQRTDGTQIVFITVDSLDGKDIREVAFDTFNFYHLGDEDKDNGVHTYKKNIWCLIFVKANLIKVYGNCIRTRQILL